jgi:hypothetical protein
MLDRNALSKATALSGRTSARLSAAVSSAGYLWREHDAMSTPINMSIHDITFFIGCKHNQKNRESALATNNFS